MSLPAGEHKSSDENVRRTLTDLGNAERFADEHGADSRYCYAMSEWFAFNGSRWQPDDSGIVEAKMKLTVRRIYAEAAQEADTSKRKEIADHAKRSESHSRIMGALALARSESGIPVQPSDLNANAWLLNVLNGTIDLRTGELRKHRRSDLITKIAPVVYDPDATAPTFERFLERILPSEAVRDFLRRVVGYAASGDVSEEALAILHGVGANGKSTLLNALMEALGDYATQAAPDLLLYKRGSHPTELADLFGARFVASVETDEGRRLAESLVKQLTGRDPIKARRMREDFWQFHPTHTLFLATNHRPEIRGTDHAIWRRIRLVPFEVAIPEGEQDIRLAGKLRAELPGILAWIVRGCLEYQRDGLGTPEAVLSATEDYRTDMDILAAFIAERCVVDSKTSAGATQLYAAYTDWCEANGETPVSQMRFGLQLREREFASSRDPETRRKVWQGIGLFAGAKPPDDDSPKHLGSPKRFETDFVYRQLDTTSRGANAEKGFRGVSGVPSVSETTSEDSPDKRHVSGSPEPEQKGSKEGKGVGTQPADLPFSANGATAPQSAEQGDSENDACRDDSLVKSEPELFGMARAHFRLEPKRADK